MTAVNSCPQSPWYYSPKTVLVCLLDLYVDLIGTTCNNGCLVVLSLKDKLLADVNAGVKGCEPNYKILLIQCAKYSNFISDITLFIKNS